MDSLNQKMADYQERLLKAAGDTAKEAAQVEIEVLRKEFEDLKSTARRFNVSQSEVVPVNVIKEAAEKIATKENVSKLTSYGSSVRVFLDTDSRELNQKAVTYNPGNQTVSGDIRMVHAITNRTGTIMLPLRPPAIQDLLTTIQTESEFIAYTRETSLTNNAAYVAEGQLKPESAIAHVVERAMVETIAHVIKVPLQLLADIKTFRSYLEERMVDMLRLASESAYLWGNGTSPNIRGIMNFAGVQTYTQVAGTNRIDAVRLALNQLELSYYPWADAIVMHPNDIVKMELLKDDEKRYLWPTFGSFASGYSNKSLFGVPIISTTLMTEGTFLIGNFSRGVTRYVRQGITVDIAFQNEDDFKRNLACLRVESREVLVPEDPKAFVIGTFVQSYN